MSEGAHVVRNSVVRFIPIHPVFVASLFVLQRPVSVVMAVIKRVKGRATRLLGNVSKSVSASLIGLATKQVNYLLRTTSKALLIQ